MTVSGRHASGLFLGRLFSRLRYPQLVALLAGLFLLDLLIPDPIPFLDEILLALLAFLLTLVRQREPVPPYQRTEKNVTPEGGHPRS